MGRTRKFSEISKTIKKLVKLKQKEIDLLEELEGYEEYGWDPFFSVINGKAVICVFGPDSEVWNFTSFEDEIQSILEAHEPQALADEIGPLWIERFEWAISQIKGAIELKTKREA